MPALQRTFVFADVPRWKNCHNRQGRGIGQGFEVTSVPDIVVRQIDQAMVDRIKTLARERSWAINDVIVHALRYGLGLTGDPFGEHEREFRSIAQLSGTWRSDESAAFKEALDALASADPEKFLEENLRKKDKSD
jgi:hypothetical protein